MGLGLAFYNSNPSPDQVGCSELRAAYWTGRCRHRSDQARCQEWHARWAVASCFPEDAHLEAHVRWARHYCTPQVRVRVG